MEAAVGQVNRGLVRPVTIAAALVGTVEALIWTCLALISTLYYNSVILLDEDLPATSYRRALYDLFLDDEANEVIDKIIVTPSIFSLFMYVYLVLSFVWLSSSLYMFWAMTRNKWSEGFVAVGGWAGITIIISLLDAALMSLVVADFVTIHDMFSSGGTTETTTPSLTTITNPTTITTIPTIPTTQATDLTTLSTPNTEPSSVPTESTTDLTTLSSTFSTVVTTLSTLTTIITEPTTVTGATSDATSDPTDPSNFVMGSRDVWGDYLTQQARDTVYIAYTIVMSLAARGYILWIVNVVFACILLKFAYDLKKEEAPSLLPILDAYSRGDRPWNNLYEQTDISGGYANDAFQKTESDAAMFPRSNSFINRNPLSNGSNPYENKNVASGPTSPNPNLANGRVAKIGKSGGRRTPPQNVPPPSVPSSPFIPDPDYTPPPSPKPKSVLRPKSNYVL